MKFASSSSLALLAAATPAAAFLPPIRGIPGRARALAAERVEFVDFDEALSKHGTAPPTASYQRHQPPHVRPPSSPARPAAHATAPPTRDASSAARSLTTDTAQIRAWSTFMPHGAAPANKWRRSWRSWRRTTRTR